MKMKLPFPQVCKGKITCYRQRPKTRGKAVRTAPPHRNHPVSLPIEASCLDFSSVLIFTDMVYVWIHKNTIITHNIQAPTCLIQTHQYNISTQ